MLQLISVTKTYDVIIRQTKIRMYRLNIIFFKFGGERGVEKLGIKNSECADETCPAYGGCSSTWKTYSSADGWKVVYAVRLTCKGIYFNYCIGLYINPIIYQGILLIPIYLQYFVSNFLPS